MVSANHASSNSALVVSFVGCPAQSVSLRDKRAEDSACVRLRAAKFFSSATIDN